jgi:tetratricopeptide (TPR) repeat protein
VPDHPRIEELRRRVQRDPASLAFAQLAEEYRRAGLLSEAVETCRAGLAFHPTYLSARVTLGRALVELGELDEAQAELRTVLGAAPENLAAVRGLAEIHQRKGELREALEYYRWALEFARHDPELEQHVREINSQLSPPRQAVTVPPPVTAPALDEPAGIVALTTAVPAPASPAAPAGGVEPGPLPDEPDEARRQLALLERWLDGIRADREQRHSAS